MSLFKKKRTKKNKILPKNFYKDLGDNNSGYINVMIQEGPYKGLVLGVDPKIKIRKDVLTNDDKLLYNYEILDETEFVLSENMPNLENIVAAIVCDIYNDALDKKDYNLETELNGTIQRNTYIKESNI
jgi:hypothetical protein